MTLKEAINTSRRELGRQTENEYSVVLPKDVVAEILLAVDVLQTKVQQNGQLVADAEELKRRLSDLEHQVEFYRSRSAA